MNCCILPYASCVYQIDGLCSDIIDAPYNSDASCFRVAGKKKMIKNLLTNFRYGIEMLENEPVFANKQGEIYQISLDRKMIILGKMNSYDLAREVAAFFNAEIEKAAGGMVVISDLKG